MLACALSVLAGSTIGAGTASADAGHVVTIDDVSAAEGGIATVSVHVSPAPAVDERVKVDFGTSAQAAQGATAKSTVAGDPTPEFPEDFVQADGTVTFNGLETDKTVTVPVAEDNADEADEIFYVNLFDVRGECVILDACTTGASIGDARATITITDDDATPALSVDDVSHAEGDAGTTEYLFTVTKSAASGRTVTVDYTTANDTAVAPGDYTTKSGSLSFDPSNTLLPETLTVTVDANGDSAFEATEKFKINLSNAAFATISDASGTGTLTNDDAAPAPGMSMSDAAGDEGGNAGFVVTLSNPPGPGQTATVDWATVGTVGDGKATEGVDYPAALGSLVFTAGEAEQTIDVATAEDIVDELNETYSVKLTRPTSHGTNGYTYTLSDDTAAGTINDDDAAPALSIDDVNIAAEGPATGTAIATFTVTKTGLSDRAVTADYATSDGTATAGSDYTSSTGELSFAPGDTTKQIAVEIKGDELNEANETVFVDLSGPTNGTVSDGHGIATITDDDATAASFAIGDVTVTEGNSGTTAATFTVTKSGLSGQSATVNYATADGWAKKVVDYTEKSGSVSFSPVETTKSVTVDVKGDTLDEVNEFFAVNLSGATNASITDGLAYATITDDDVAPSIALGNASVTESASKACTLLVKLSAPSGKNVTFHYATVSGTAGTADYVAKSGDMTFVAGDDAMQIKIFAKSDTKDEPTETFRVQLSGISPTGAATFADSTGTCSIIDND